MCRSNANDGTRYGHVGFGGRPGAGRGGRGRRADAGRGPHRPGRGRVLAAGGRTRRGYPDRGRGHPPRALAGVEPEHRAQGARRLLLRRRRGAPHGRTARRAQGGPGHPARHRRGHPGDQRSRLPARRGRGRGRPAGDRPAGPVGGDDRAGRLRAAYRQVQLRGVSASRPGRTGQALRRAGRRPPHPGLLRVRPQAGDDAGRARRLPRRGPPGRGMPRAHQDPRGDQARHAGRTGRVGGPGQRGGSPGAQKKKGGTAQAPSVARSRWSSPASPAEAGAGSATRSDLGDLGVGAAARCSRPASRRTRSPPRCPG